MITRKDLQEAFADVLARVQQWEGQDSPNVNWRGQTVKAMSEDVLTALDSFGAVRDESDIDDDAKSIVLAVDAMDDQFQAWVAASEQAYDSVHPMGTAELWAAFRMLKAEMQDVPRRLPESMASLADKSVGLAQIAKIYGFLNEDGSSDTAKVMEEMNAPGTHYHPETWVSAAERRRQREIEARWNDRNHIPVDRITNTAPRPKRVAPEPLDKLIADNVPSAQIAKMKGIRIEEVERRAAELGIALDGKFRHPVAAQNPEAAQQRIAQERQDAYKLSHPEIGHMEERIIACALDDMKPAQIAEALRLDYPALTWEKVTDVIRAADEPVDNEQDPELATS